MRVGIVEAIKELRDSRKNHGNERKRKERYDKEDARRQEWV